MTLSNSFATTVEAVVVPPPDGPTALVDFIGYAEDVGASYAEPFHLTAIALEVLAIDEPHRAAAVVLRLDRVFHRHGIGAHHKPGKLRNFR